MRCPSALADEPERLQALAQYGLSGERPLPSLDPVVQLAARAFDVPIAAVNMIGRDEVFFAASVGIDSCDMRRDVSFCAHAITQDDVLVVEDARLDERFHDNPLVTSPEGIRFYAGVPVRSPDGHALGALCLVDSKPHASFPAEERTRLKELAKLVTDRLELRRLEVAGSHGRGKFERIALTSPNGIVCCDAGGTITAINPAALRVFGKAAEAVVGGPLSHLLPTWRQTGIAALLEQPAVSGRVVSDVGQDVLGRRSDGSDVPLEVAFSTWLEGDELGFGLVLRDLTEQRRQEDELHRLANFDQATGLPNRRLFEQRLKEEIAAGRPASILVLGLSGFRDLNDTLGQRVGEQILKEVAARLLTVARPTDSVAKIAADEFAILLPGIADPIRPADVAAAAMAGIARPVLVEGQEIRASASCGICLTPTHGNDAEELIGNSNLALQEARKQGPGRSYLFVQALRMQAVARRLFDAELHRAVEREEFEVYYQPQVRLSDGSLAGAEALLRWNHPERGVLSPGAFLPALDASPLAAVVGSWVIDIASRQAAAWRRKISPDFRMSINLFAAQLRGGGLRAFVQSVAERYCLPEGAIELEITETTVLDGNPQVLPLLRGLREDGVELAFDDFGTGFASLSLLNLYPLTHLKIDKSFVQKAFGSAGDRAIVEAIADLARRLDLEVIAEGVETREQLDFCRQIGCHEAQGFLTGRPMSAAAFEAAVRQGKLHRRVHEQQRGRSSRSIGK